MGDIKYQNDPEVQAMLQSIPGDSLCTLTQKSTESKDDNNDIEERITKIEEQLAKQQEKSVLKRSTDMDMFVQFQEQYGEYRQVSYRDIF